MKKDIKSCVIGLDGVGYINLQRILERYSLKGISKATSRGKTYSPFSYPPYTPIIWTDIFTGVNLGKHGIYGFIKIDREVKELRFANSNDVKYPRIFEIFSLNKLRSIVINIPMTYPFSGVIGRNRMVVVSDLAAPIQEVWPKREDEKYREDGLICSRLMSSATIGFLRKSLTIYAKGKM